MANSEVSAWENQRLLRCEKWPRKDKTCRRTKCWNKATNDSNQLRRARMWTTPEVDRGRLDPPNFTAVVQEHESETGLYTLGTRAGTLNTRFSRNQFNLMNQKFLTTADVPEDVTLSVREAARLHSNTGGQGFFKCLCQTACLTKKCKCIRDSVKCISRCHKNRSCQNHDIALSK